MVPFLIHICDVPACLDEIRSSEDKIQRIGKKMGWSEWASWLNFALDGRFVQAAKGIEDTIPLRTW